MPRMSEQTLKKVFLPFWQQLAMEVLSQRYVGYGSHIGVAPNESTYMKAVSIYQVIGSSRGDDG